jgi:shikimate dehydrogenase
MRGAIIGKDIGYTKSPLLYNTYFKDNNINGSYEILDFKKEENLRDFINSKQFNEYDFFNITQPYKSVFLEYINNSDIIVNETASVNLVINNKTELLGFNTDAEGFYNYYFDKLVGCSVSEILLVGTGAMARTAKVYIQQATIANISVMSPRNNKIPEFFNDVKKFHPENTDGPSMCYKFDLMIFAASHKAEKMVAEMPIHVERIINLNYQSTELKDFAMLNRLKYTGGEFMLIEQFKENLRQLNIYNKKYDYNNLLIVLN